MSSSRVAASQAWLAFSASSQPSSLPGIVDLGIGAGFTQLDVWPIPVAVDASGIARFDLPSVPTMAGVNLWFQGLLLGSTLPLSSTNVDGTSYQ